MVDEKIVINKLENVMKNIRADKEKCKHSYTKKHFGHDGLIYLLNLIIEFVKDLSKENKL